MDHLKLLEEITEEVSNQCNDFAILKEKRRIQPVEVDQLNFGLGGIFERLEEKKKYFKQQ